jgi:hypothetical protein
MNVQKLAEQQVINGAYRKYLLQISRHTLVEDFKFFLANITEKLTTLFTPRSLEMCLGCLHGGYHIDIY